MADSAGIGHIDKSSLPGVFEKPILAHTGNQDVRKSVVVVIAHRHAHSVHFDIESGVVSYVGESSIAIVVIEPKRRRLPLVAGPVHAVDQENVLPAIAIVVEKGASRSKGFRKKLASVGAAVVLEMNAG